MKPIKGRCYYSYYDGEEWVCIQPGDRWSVMETKRWFFKRRQCLYNSALLEKK